MFKLRLRHLIDDFQNDVSLPCHRRTDKKNDGNVRTPILTISEKYFAYFSQIQIAYWRIRVHDYSYVNFVALSRKWRDKCRAQTADCEDSE